MATPKQTDPQFKLRLPLELKERIETAAQRNNRSMNAEIVERLEGYGRLIALQPRVSQMESENQRLQAEVEQLQSANESLSRAITDAATEFDGVDGADRVDVLLSVLHTEIKRRKSEFADAALVVENAVLKSQIAKLEAEEPIFNIVLDAKGRPLSWPEIAAHVHRTAKAAGIETASFRAAIFNAEKQDDEKFFGEYARLIRWYQDQTRKHKGIIRGDES